MIVYLQAIGHRFGGLGFWEPWLTGPDRVRPLAFADAAIYAAL